MAARRATLSSIAEMNTPSTCCTKSRLSWSSKTSMKDKAVSAILGAARTGHIGDGKIFISRIDEAIRIRNDERGETVL